MRRLSRIDHTTPRARMFRPQGWWAAPIVLAWTTLGSADSPALTTTSQTQASITTTEETQSATDATAALAQPSGMVNFVPNATNAPAMKYSKMDRAACEAELGRRTISFARVIEARGVLAPVRLTSKLHGVSFHSALPASARPTSPYEILDCRLVLALDDFSVILAKYDVVEVVHMSVYRPPSARGWAAGHIGKQHSGGLAIDAGSFVKKDGTTLQVERDFHGAIGAPTCGAGTGPAPSTPEALTLRKLACEAADAHLFNVELTPDYNWQHRNHFHLEVTPNVTWFMVH